MRKPSLSRVDVATCRRGDRSTIYLRPAADHPASIRTLSGLLRLARCPLGFDPGGCCHLAGGFRIKDLAQWLAAVTRTRRRPKATPDSYPAISLRLDTGSGTCSCSDRFLGRLARLKARIILIIGLPEMMKQDSKLAGDPYHSSLLGVLSAAFGKLQSPAT